MRYTVSTGPGSIAIPDIRNFDRKDAEQALKQAGFTNIAFDERDDPNTGKDKVIETDPAIANCRRQGHEDHRRRGQREGRGAGGPGRTGLVSRVQRARAGRPQPEARGRRVGRDPGTVISVEKEGRRVDVGSEIKVEVAKAPTPEPTTETVTQTQTVTQPPETTEPTTTTTEPPGGGGNGNG